MWPQFMKILTNTFYLPRIVYVGMKRERERERERRAVNSFYFYRHLLLDRGHPNKPHPLVIKYIRGVVSQLSNVTQSLHSLEDLLSMLWPHPLLTMPDTSYYNCNGLRLLSSIVLLLCTVSVCLSVCLYVCMYVDFPFEQSVLRNFSSRLTRRCIS